MTREMESLKFTGERVVPGQMRVDPATYAEHLVRYAFAVKYAGVDRILDVACGTGYGMRLLGSMGAFVCGIDKDIHSVNYAHNQLIGTDYHIMILDFEEMEFSNHYTEKFDLITCFETIEHLNDPAFLLESCRESLAPVGMFIFSIPLNNPSNYHKKVYTVEAAKELIERYFEAIKYFKQFGTSIIAEGLLGYNGQFLIGVCKQKRMRKK